MVHFGKRLLALEYEPWKDYYLDYNGLKKFLEKASYSHSYQTEYQQQTSQEEESCEFVRRLDGELEKAVLFFLSQQGEVAARLSELRQEQHRCASEIRSSQHDGDNNGRLQRLRDLAEAYRSVGQDVVHLVHFVELNVTGIRKILKKHDKNCRTKLSQRYLSQNYWVSDGSHLRQLFHCEGIGALVATLQSGFLENRALEQILHGTILSGQRKSIHRRTHTSPDMVSLLHDNSLQMEHTSLIRRNTTLEDIHNWKDNVTLIGEPVLFKIDIARRRLEESSTYVSVLAASAMVLERQSSDGDFAVEEADLMLPKKTRRVSNLLNYLSTFLYMTGYYIAAPTSGAYAARLGGHEALAGIIIGMTSFAALASTILYSWWTTRSYKAALIFASTCSIVGNILYALGLPCQNLILVLFGRLLNGFGSARAINRRYIADAFSRQERTAASATFVTASALGMAFGPAMAALLDVFTPEDNVYWSVENAPGWFMAFLWTIELAAIVIAFEDPPRAPSNSDIEMAVEKAALLSSSIDNEFVSKSQAPSPPLWKNVPVMMTLLIYFVLKLALECTLSSTATLTQFYFDWGAQESGLYLAVLGLLLFPANLLVAYFSRRYEDREFIVVTLIIMLVGSWGMVDYGIAENYSLQHYLTFGVVVFVSAQSLEGPNMALLSKTIPHSWAKGIFNVGLLAGESGTLGRVVGDIFITWCGLRGIDHLLNSMYICLGFIVGLTLSLTYAVYNYLEPFDQDG